MTDTALPDSTTHRYNDSRVTGLDNIAMELPAVNSDAVRRPNYPVLLGKPPTEYADTIPGIDVGEPAMAFGPAWNDQSVPNTDVTDVQQTVIGQFQDDVPGHIGSVDPADLDVGETFLLGGARLTFKRYEGSWILTRYRLEPIEPEMEEFLEETSQ